MKNERVMTGRHFMQGNIACAEGAMAAGCSFMAGYPITPATEIAERLAARLPSLRGDDGVFIQMEDEISSLAAVIGASWMGKKAMTATSGPGLSLMMEHLGLAIGVETPCVIVDVQRGGPTTGIPSVELQGDMVQARRGSHGEYQIIAVAPSSPQEMFDHTILAFNLAERFRTPVLVMADAFVGHMHERVDIPEPGRIETSYRVIPEAGFDGEKDQGFLSVDVAPMPIFGRGFKSHVTSSCHTETGKRNVTDAYALDNFIRKLSGKIEKNRDEIVQVEDRTKDAEIVIFAYGSIHRVALEAAEKVNREGLNVGTFRPVTVWPFPDREIAEFSKKVKAILVLENNLGQILPYVQAAASCPVHFLEPEILGTLHDVERVVNKLKEASK
jgi:2-oxoglutarate/2-oxoacid ferredoxin oxidoreductase subunit alpha